MVVLVLLKTFWVSIFSTSKFLKGGIIGFDTVVMLEIRILGYFFLHLPPFSI